VHRRRTNCFDASYSDGHCIRRDTNTRWIFDGCHRICPILWRRHSWGNSHCVVDHNLITLKTTPTRIVGACTHRDNGYVFRVTCHSAGGQHGSDVANDRVLKSHALD
jgi:hypothetical protein